MKKIITICLLLISIQFFSQVSVGPTNIGKAKKFKKGTLDKFKATTTVFVLNEKYSVEEYNTILKQVWNVTPFIIVKPSEFNIVNFLHDKYSIFQIKGFTRTSTSSKGTTSTSLFINLDLNMYNSSLIAKKLEKLSPKRIEKKIDGIIQGNRINLAQIPLYPKDEFVFSGKSSKVDAMFKDDVFFNYHLGLLKNYFQKINELLERETEYWLYKSGYNLELNRLSANTLYVPEYLGVKYNGWIGKDSEQDDDNIQNLFKGYDYDFKILDNQELSDVIISGKEIYYIRYTRRNAERFLNIVNSKTGEIVYSDYMAGFASYKIKAKHIGGIEAKIRKAIKKSSK